MHPPTLKLTNTLHSSFTEEYPQRDVIMSELAYCNYSDFINISKQSLCGKQTMMSRKENEINKYTKVPRTIK